MKETTPVEQMSPEISDSKSLSNESNWASLLVKVEMSEQNSHSQSSSQSSTPSKKCKQLQNETPEARVRRLQRISENQKKRLKRETSEERATRLQKVAEYRRQRILTETPEERERRLKRVSENQQKRIEKETPEQRARRLKNISKYRKQVIQRETPEERARRLQRISENQKRRIKTETPEERAKRLERISLNQKLRLRNETPEARARRLRRPIATQCKLSDQSQDEDTKSEILLTPLQPPIAEVYVDSVCEDITTLSSSDKFPSASNSNNSMDFVAQEVIPKVIYREPSDSSEEELEKKEYDYAIDWYNPYTKVVKIEKNLGCKRHRKV